MYAVVRTYSGPGAKELFDLLEKRKAEGAVIRSVPGLVSYTLVRSQEGGMAVTVCEDKADTPRSHFKVTLYSDMPLPLGLRAVRRLGREVYGVRPVPARA